MDEFQELDLNYVEIENGMVICTLGDWCYSIPVDIFPTRRRVFVDEQMARFVICPINNKEPIRIINAEKKRNGAWK